MEKELKYLQEELADPARPFLVILGGSKVSDKIGVIKALMDKANTFLIGGAMAYTFYRALGIPTGNSRVEKDKVNLAHEILALAKEKGVKFLLPMDNVETQEFKAGTTTARNTQELTAERGITDGYEAVDIGSRTIELYKQEIAGAKTILWNGPVGVFEIPDFAHGTFSPRQGSRRSGRGHHHRRWRQRDGGQAGGLGRSNDVHFDGRWCLARTARRQGSSRRGGSDGQGLICAKRSWPPTGR